MTDKLAVIINSIKAAKIKKLLLYEMKFLVPNYSCLQNPSLARATAPRSPFSVLYPQPNLLNPPPNKIPGYATATQKISVSLRTAKDKEQATRRNFCLQNCTVFVLDRSRGFSYRQESLGSRVIEKPYED